MKLPPYVQAVPLRNRTKYRGYADVPASQRAEGDPGRVYGALRDDPQTAYADAMRMRDVAATGLVGVSLADAMDAVTEENESKCAAGTVEWYEDQFAAILKEIPGETLLHDIGPEQIEAFVRERQKKASAATIAHHLTALHRVFAFAALKGDFKGENPVRRVRKPRAEVPAIHYFTEGELAALLARVTDQAAHDLFVLFAYTGIRRSEAARLVPEHVSPAALTLFIRGKRRNRVVPIAEEASAAIARVVVPMTTKAIDDTFRLWRRKLGEPRLHAHALRHTFGTTLVRNGVELNVVMHLLGHQTLQMTMRYAHVAGRDAADAVRKLRLLPASERRSKDAEA